MGDWISEYRDAHLGVTGWILCNGPSLPVDRLDEIPESHITIGVNRTCFVKDTSYLVALDKEWFVEPEPGTAVKKYGRRLFTCEGRFDGATELRRLRRRRFWSWDLNEGAVMSWAGTTALQVAVWMGLNPILFLGLDGGGGHFDNSPGGKVPHMALGHNRAFKMIKPGLRSRAVWVFNCSKAGAAAMDELPYISLDDALTETR